MLLVCINNQDKDCLMDIIKGHNYAVITGDIIGSKRFSKEDRQSVYALMKAGSQAVCRYFEQDFPLDIAIARGDEWQALVVRPCQALRIALYYRATLKGGMPDKDLDTRFAIGIGTVNFIPEDNAAEGDGAAFNLSGKTLDGLDRFTIGVAVEHEAFDHFTSALQAAALLVDSQAQQWTAPQAQAVSGMLLGWKQSDIASAWQPAPISQQAVSRHLQSAGWPFVEQGLSIYEDLIVRWA